MSNKRTISILVDNQPGVLTRVAGLFARRGFNIESLAVGETEKPETSRITIVTVGDEQTLFQIKNQLRKLEDVRLVRDYADDESARRELVLIKLKVNMNQRAELASLADIVDARICDITPTTLTIELNDCAESNLRVIELVRPYGILEFVRTGTVALRLGEETIEND